MFIVQFFHLFLRIGSVGGTLRGKSFKVIVIVYKPMCTIALITHMMFSDLSNTYEYVFLHARYYS